MDYFDIYTEQVDDGVHVISVTGEVDLSTAQAFKEHLLAAIAEGSLHVIVDFTHTTFIDSITLGVLVGGVKRLRTVGGELILVFTNPNIATIIGITGLDRVFRTFATRDEAIAGLATHASA